MNKILLLLTIPDLPACREKLGIEYINIEATLDHWNYGPHHVWVYPDTGNILRMWQPFNGLQIYPDGVGQYDY